MKAKNYLLTIAMMVSGSVLFAQTMEVDTKKSSIGWHGSKIGGEHDGFIQLQSGSFEMEGDQIVAGNFVVDMATITNTDLKDEGRNQRLVGHLKSDDFFGVETYPTATFKVVQSSEFTNGKATLTGDITIKDKTERISFDVMKTGKEYSATVELDRSKFDVRYGSKSFFDNLGDNVIHDIFTLRIKLVVI
jgi:polyisoprenoid-binding protein YceI